MPFVRSTRAGKPNTVRFYKNSVANLSADSKLADLPLDQINAEIVAESQGRAARDRSVFRREGLPGVPRAAAVCE